MGTLSPEERRKLALKAAQARWARPKSMKCRTSLQLIWNDRLSIPQGSFFMVRFPAVGRSRRSRRRTQQGASTTSHADIRGLPGRIRAEPHDSGSDRLTRYHTKRLAALGYAVTLTKRAA